MAAARQLTARLLRLGPALPRALGLPAGLQLVSWLSTNSKPPLDAAELSRQLTARQLWEDELALLREKTSSLPYSRVLDLAQQQGLTAEAAQDAITRLERSGALLNLAGTVLLRPGEVAEALQLVLPGSAADTEQRLAAVREELGGLEARQAAIGRRASRRQLAFVWGGLGSQAALWALLFRLTFYELSWDVMEPICFFVGGAQAMMCYFYFMLTRREFTWESALDRYVGRWEAQQLQRAGFDATRFLRLKKEAARLGELLAAQREQEAAAAAAAEAEAEAAADEAAAKAAEEAAGEGKKEA